MTTPHKDDSQNNLRDILGCSCSYDERYDGKTYNLKTEKYDDCSCVSQLQDLTALIATAVQGARIEQTLKIMMLMKQEHEAMLKAANMKIYPDDSYPYDSILMDELAALQANKEES